MVDSFFLLCYDLSMFITDDNMYSFKQNDAIRFQPFKNSLISTGKIVGVSTSPQPGIGRQYIVEVTDSLFPSNDYPFTHMVVFECSIINHPNEVTEDAIH